VITVLNIRGYTNRAIVKKYNRLRSVPGEQYFSGLAFNFPRSVCFLLVRLSKKKIFSLLMILSAGSFKRFISAANSLKQWIKFLFADMASVCNFF
jgi:hypothetical protein